MKKQALALLGLGVWLGASSARATDVELVIDVAGSVRTVVIRLDDSGAPLTSANFARLCDEGFYEGISFHRIIPNYIVQSGDPLTKDESARERWGTGGPDYTIPAEPGLPHLRGAIAAARLGDSVNPEKASSGSQFYVALRDIPALDGGYTVFGNVIEGLDVFDDISGAPTDENNTPTLPIVITGTRVLPVVPPAAALAAAAPESTASAPALDAPLDPSAPLPPPPAPPSPAMALADSAASEEAPVAEPSPADPGPSEAPAASALAAAASLADAVDAAASALAAAETPAPAVLEEAAPLLADAPPSFPAEAGSGADALPGEPGQPQAPADIDAGAAAPLAMETVPAADPVEATDSLVEGSGFAIADLLGAGRALPPDAESMPLNVDRGLPPMPRLTADPDLLARATAEAESVAAGRGFFSSDLPTQAPATQAPAQADDGFIPLAEVGVGAATPAQASRPPAWPSTPPEEPAPAPAAPAVQDSAPAPASFPGAAVSDPEAPSPSGSEAAVDLTPAAPADPGAAPTNPFAPADLARPAPREPENPPGPLGRLIRRIW